MPEVAMHSRIVRAVTLLSAVLPAGAVAQTGTVGVGLSGLSAIPVGPLAGVGINVGVGATASLRYALPGLPSLAIRVEASGLTASHANAPSTVCPCGVNTITTRSSGLLAGVGPELSVPVGRLRAYTIATAGIAQLWNSAVRSGGVTPESNGSESRSGTRATSFAWSGGGGLAVPLSSSRTPATLEFGLRYYDAGSARYFKAERLTPAVITTARLHSTFIAPSVGIVLHY
jgi:hypothetical protein